MPPPISEEKRDRRAEEFDTLLEEILETVATNGHKAAECLRDMFAFVREEGNMPQEAQVECAEELRAIMIPMTGGRRPSDDEISDLISKMRELRSRLDL
jgi:hypothetical protein